jgi:hypothetical protein
MLTPALPRSSVTFPGREMLLPVGGRLDTLGSGKFGSPWARMHWASFKSWSMIRRGVPALFAPPSDSR